VIDFDVHHGNGTEDIFGAPQWRERVLMTGFFQHPFYPYSGTDDPAPNMLNVPLAAGSGGAAARQAVTQVWLPALERLRAAVAADLRGIRRACGRSARRHVAARRGLRVDHA
jgi:acetoin utilization deacetylase AcuC-like enzyme